MKGHISKIALGFTDHIFSLAIAAAVAGIVTLLFLDRSKRAKISAFVLTTLVVTSVRIWSVIESLAADTIMRHAYSTGGEARLREVISSMTDDLAEITRMHALIPTIAFSITSFIVIWIPGIRFKIVFAAALLLGVFYFTGDYHDRMFKRANLIPVMGLEALK